MDAYSKIKSIGRSEARSQDAQEKPTDDSRRSNPAGRGGVEKEGRAKSEVKNGRDSSLPAVDRKQEDETTVVEPRLIRNRSVASGYAIQHAVKRAFSMRRSSSVTDRYYRIHDQSLTSTWPLEDDEDQLETDGPGRSANKETKKKRTTKIFKACKKLFGL